MEVTQGHPLDLGGAPPSQAIQLGPVSTQDMAFPRLPLSC